MRRVAGQDLAALERLYERYRRPLLGFLGSLYRGDPAACEDAAHEVFLRLWRAAPRYEPRAKFTTYLFQIAKNFWLNERERRMRGPSLGLDGPGEAEDRGTGGPVDRGPSPDVRAASDETRARVRRAVDALPEGQRLVVILADFQGLPYKEVAEILEIPVGTVKSRRHAADQRLREALGGLAADGAAHGPPTPAGDAGGHSA